MKSNQHKHINYTVSPRVYKKMQSIAKKSGVSMAGITRFVVEESLGIYSDIVPHRTHSVKKRVISDVTIRIAKGIRVKIV